MLPSTSFFRRTELIKKKTGAEKTAIDVGGDPFRALAAAVIDNLKNGASLPDESLKEILGRFFHHFPEYKTNQLYVTFPERMRLLINSSRKAEIVDCLAYVLRQLTVDELLRNPLAYKETFKGLNGDLPQDYLRKKDTSLPSSALAALAATLNIKITLSFKEPKKELRKREVYSRAGASSFEVVLQVQDDSYSPKVSNKEYFVSMAQASNTPQPVALLGSGTIAQQLDLIVEDNQKIWQNYEQYSRSLNGLVSDEELTRVKLVALYRQFLPQHSDLQLFTQLEKAYGKPIVVESPINTEQELVTMLVEALARGLSTKQINADDFFETLEQPMQRHSAAPAA